MGSFTASPLECERGGQVGVSRRVLIFSWNTRREPAQSHRHFRGARFARNVWSRTGPGAQRHHRPGRRLRLGRSRPVTAARSRRRRTSTGWPGRACASRRPTSRPRSARRRGAASSPASSRPAGGSPATCRRGPATGRASRPTSSTRRPRRCPEHLKEAGYATAHIGKWHLGGGRDVTDAPKFAAYGYDLGLGTYESPEPHPDITAQELDLVARRQGKRWDRARWMVDRTLDVPEGEPGQAVLRQSLARRHAHAVGAVGRGPDDGKKGGRRARRHAGAASSGAGRDGPTDRPAAGRAAGREARRPTIVIFLGDNGPLPTFGQARTGGLRGSKLSLYEGGIRVPCIAWGPGLVKAGVTNDDYRPRLASICFPTLASSAARAARRDYEPDGEDLSDALRRHGDTDADEAAVLGVRPQRHVLRLPEGRRQPQPERGRARRRTGSCW